jgi:hypothetical protein
MSLAIIATLRLVLVNFESEATKKALKGAFG